MTHKIPNILIINFQGKYLGLDGLRERVSGGIIGSFFKLRHPIKIIYIYFAFGFGGLYQTMFNPEV